MRNRILADRSTTTWLGVLAVMLAVSAITGFPAPLGVLVQGAVTGSVVGFIALGLVLVYRTNRIINFAQAEIGGVGMVVGVLLVAQTGWNYFLGISIGIALSVALAGLIEVAVIRRFFRAPRLILTVATIALTQLLVLIRVILPALWDVELANPRLDAPIDATIRIPDPTGETTAVLFGANHLLTLFVVPVVIVGLVLFLQRTRSGVASRAVADNSERASLLGIPVKRVSTIVWIVAGALSAVGALLRAGTLGLPILGPSFDSGLLVRALAPAVVAGMSNLPTTFVVAVVLGVVDQSSFYATADPAISNTILFVVILGALLMRRKGQVSRGQETEGATWQAVKEIRPVPAELRNLKEVVQTKRALVSALVVGGILFGLFASGNAVDLAALILVFGIIGASLVILTGWAGQISLGQVAFVAVGALITGKFAMEGDMNVLLALLLGSAIGGVVAVVIGLPALRIQGLFLAASTLAFALFVSSMALNQNYFGFLVPIGRMDRPDLFVWDLNQPRTFYMLVLILFIGVVVTINGLRRGRTGRVLIGARDNERAAKSFAVNVTRVRLTAFAFSGFYAALAGGLFALHQNTVNAVSFGVEKSLDAFVMVVIGGLGSLPGAQMGAAFFYLTQFLLDPRLALLFSGLGMLVVLMIYPGGIGQILYDRRDAALRWFAGRRGIVVPSLLADTATEDAHQLEKVEAPS